AACRRHFCKQLAGRPKYPVTDPTYVTSSYRWRSGQLVEFDGAVGKHGKTAVGDRWRERCDPSPDGDCADTALLAAGRQTQPGSFRLRSRCTAHATEALLL